MEEERRIENLPSGYCSLFVLCVGLGHRGLQPPLCPAGETRNFYTGEVAQAAGLCGFTIERQSRELLKNADFGSTCVPTLSMAKLYRKTQTEFFQLPKLWIFVCKDTYIT